MCCLTKSDTPQGAAGAPTAVVEVPVVSVLLVNAFLDETGPMSESLPVNATERTLVLSVEVVKGFSEAGDAVLEVALEGTYDGRLWSSSGLPALGWDLPELTDVGPSEQVSAASTVSYAFVRARATLAGDKAAAYIRRVTVAFSKQ